MCLGLGLGRVRASARTGADKVLGLRSKLEGLGRNGVGVGIGVRVGYGVRFGVEVWEILVRESCSWGWNKG